MFMFQFVQQPANGMIDYFETKSQPITKAMFSMAFGKVRANKGGVGADGMTWLESIFSVNKVTVDNLRFDLAPIENAHRQTKWLKLEAITQEIIHFCGIRFVRLCVRYLAVGLLEPLFHESSFG